MKKTILNEQEYEIIKNDKDCFDKEKTESLLTEYFEEYDYILGDYAYDKLRLKGFQEKHNPKVNKINNIETLEKYLKEQCAYGARHFLLKKVKG